MMTENSTKEVENRNKDTEQRRGILWIILSATGFGLIAIFAKFAYEENVGVFTLMTLRFLSAGMFIGIFLTIKKEKLTVEKNQLYKLIALGVLGQGVMSAFFFNAVKLVPASIAAILLYTYPALVTILAYLLYKESINKHHVTALAFSFVGLILVVGVALKGLNVLGIGYAAGAAVVYALYITISSRAVKDISPNVVSFYITLSAGAAFALGGLLTDSLNFWISVKGWFAIAGYAVFSTGVATIAFFKGMQLIGPSKSSIVSTVEPVITTLAAFILFQEKITLTQLFGGLLILFAVLKIHREGK